MSLNLPIRSRASRAILDLVEVQKSWKSRRRWAQQAALGTLRWQASGKCRLVRCNMRKSQMRGYLPQNQDFVRARIMSAAFSAIIVTGACVLPEGIVGMTDASAMLSPAIP